MGGADDRVGGAGEKVGRVADRVIVVNDGSKALFSCLPLRCVCTCPHTSLEVMTTVRCMEKVMIIAFVV